MDEVKLARTELRELVEVVQPFADAAFAARQQAAQADAMALHAVDLLINIGDTLVSAWASIRRRSGCPS